MTSESNIKTHTPPTIPVCVILLLKKKLLQRRSMRVYRHTHQTFTKKTGRERELYLHCWPLHNAVLMTLLNAPFIIKWNDKNVITGQRYYFDKGRVWASFERRNLMHSPWNTPTIPSPRWHTRRNTTTHPRRKTRSLRSGKSLFPRRQKKNRHGASIRRRGTGRDDGSGSET